MNKILKDLRLPVMVAPMFLVSGVELLLASCRAGVIGSLPTPNARTITILRSWLTTIKNEIRSMEMDGHDVPWLLNMIVHRTYDRFDAELDLVTEFQPPIVSTALGSPKRVVNEVHQYGGQVLADVTNITLAKKAIDAGVDGLILVCHGAGGHTGLYNPFAFIAEVRKFWTGPIGLSGAIMNGRDIHASQVLGADFSVMGTRFLGTKESMIVDDYRTMLINSGLEDIVTTDKVSGVPANWMRSSLEKNGISLVTNRDQTVNFSGNIANDKKAWKDVWSAGEGVGQIHNTGSVGDLVEMISLEYQKSTSRKNFDL